MQHMRAGTGSPSRHSLGSRVTCCSAPDTIRHLSGRLDSARRATTGGTRAHGRQAGRGGGAWVGAGTCCWGREGTNDMLA